MTTTPASDAKFSVKPRTLAVVTGAYWVFTISDGALRTLVLLFFHDIGYSPVQLAFLFLLYEFFGVITNLFGGLIGSRRGLQRTLHYGLATQVVALLVLTAFDESWSQWLAVSWVMGAQALSGVAKDLTKMSSKSAVKFVAERGEADDQGRLFRWVAALTGSKNALKGVGFFVGGVLLETVGFDNGLRIMAAILAVTLVAALALLDEPIGKSKERTTRASLWSTSDALNRLSAARVFLFGARDIWFVVALPVFLDDELGWSFSGVGAFLAAWVIGYGIVQSIAPAVLRATGGSQDVAGAAVIWAAVLLAVSTTISLAAVFDVALELAILGGLIIFGLVFAVNSSVHSYLVLAYAEDDRVALDVGFYYSANATGRLVGTLLSGVLFLLGGIEVALVGSTAFLLATLLLTRRLPPVPTPAIASQAL